MALLPPTSRDQHLLDLAVLYPGGIIASDAMPWIDKTTGKIIDADVWPLPKNAFAHPRTAATYVKFLIDYVRDRQAETLIEAVARCSFRPAQILGEYVSQMKRKRNIYRGGMDADIIVFDVDKLEVRATYTDPNQRDASRHCRRNATRSKTAFSTQKRFPDKRSGGPFDNRHKKPLHTESQVARQPGLR